MSLFWRKKSGKVFPVKISTMDAELEFSLDYKVRITFKMFLFSHLIQATGQELFDLVCRTIGLREAWYCGLQYQDCKGYIAWLKLDKKVASYRSELSNTVLVRLWSSQMYPRQTPCTCSSLPSSTPRMSLRSSCRRSLSISSSFRYSLQ